MDMFFFKRLVGGLAQPVPLLLFFMAAALVLLFGVDRRRRRLGLTSLLASFVLLAATTFPHLGRHVARRLETGRMPIGNASEFSDSPRLIAVLGNGVDHPDDSSLPALTRLNGVSRARLVEGVRLAWMFPDAKLAVCGDGGGLEACADAMAGAAVELGVDKGRVERLVWPRNTEEEARAVAGLADGGIVLLVTSAMHMERAMRVFEIAGVKAVAAPCDYEAPLSDQALETVNRHYWRPGGGGLVIHEKAWHEGLGLVYMGLFGGGPGEGEGRK